jgi:hypothetical protein
MAKTFILPKTCVWACLATRILFKLLHPNFI